MENIVEFLFVLSLYDDILNIVVKVLDWGEDGVSSVAEIAALRTSFRQEVAVWHKLDHPNVAKVQLRVSFTCRIWYDTMSNKSNSIHMLRDYANRCFDSLHLVLALF